MKRGRDDDVVDGGEIPAVYVKPHAQATDIAQVLAALQLDAIDVNAWLMPSAQQCCLPRQVPVLRRSPGLLARTRRSCDMRVRGCLTRRAPSRSEHGARARGW